MRRDTVPPPEGVDETGRLGVTQAVRNLINRQARAGQIFVRERLAHLVAQLGVGRAFFLQATAQGARNHVQTTGDLGHRRALRQTCGDTLAHAPGQAAARRGHGLAFAHEAAGLIWGGAANWHEGDHLAQAASAAGLDFTDLEAEARDDADALAIEIAANQQALEDAGHWGVPTLVFDGEPFFGQDRIDIARWRMEQKGLQAR